MEIEFIGGSGFDAIYEQHKAKIFQTAMMYTKEWHTAEDITQEAFLRYYIYMEHASIDNTRQWLLTTTRNIALNYRRDRSREQLVDLKNLVKIKWIAVRALKRYSLENSGREKCLHLR